MLWLVLLAAALLAAVFVARSMAKWHANAMREVKRRDAVLNVTLRRKRRELDKVSKALNDLREQESSFARLVANNRYGQPSDPGEWLLDNRHITLSLYLKAKKLAQRKEIDIVGACLELGAIDKKLAREALMVARGENPEAGEPGAGGTPPASGSDRA
ncbi:hypothetical protein dsx2_0490 [Desulfovibrio sp. X2]|uniref:hypothetical protein n=1 Tax=Desulfovibrio sp. X2 TaxID=941449 RepID=UPI000358A1C8|nr:hypothetical protein [Desulfovibrio sp. X2]EPR38681.1 hypothetical protein dsx2_0490 [Desulfovibrio sp. X2]